jgi:homocysteine S-methyltransferase
MRPLAPEEYARIRVLDGGMATELERRGFDLRGPLWSAQVLASSPEAIAGVHLDYLRAGADCISTVSYQISARGYAELGRGQEAAAQALRQSVELAGQARASYLREIGLGESGARPILIAASLGPFGAALHNGAEYHGRYAIGFEELVDFHRERLAVLAAMGANGAADLAADLVAFETVPSLEEARAIVAALAEFPQVSAWISFTCRDEAHVAHGERLEECARLLDPGKQVLAVGVNCTAPHLIEALLGEARAGTSKPLLAYPNSGERWDAQTRTWQGRGDAEAELARYAEMARRWYRAGAQAVGGCCRTGPEHIRAVLAARG